MWLDMLLFSAAFLAGIVNSMAGGGTLLTFPALLSAGLPAVTANATSTVALVPGSLSAFWGYRGEVRGEGRLLAAMAVPSLMGGTLGALAADRVGDAVFAKLAPLLVLARPFCFMAQEPLRRWSGSVSGLGGAGGREAGALGCDRRFSASGGSLRRVLRGRHRHPHAGIPGTARSPGHPPNERAQEHRRGLHQWACGFDVRRCGRVNWPIASFMMVGGIAGGYTGAGLARRIGQQMVRRLIVLIGLLISFYLFLRLAFRP